MKGKELTYELSCNTIDDLETKKQDKFITDKILDS